MEEIKEWMQGPENCEGYDHKKAIPWSGGQHCLGTAIHWEYNSMELMADIIGRLFPERICDHGKLMSKIIHFNNHPNTTRDQIDKIIHEYKMEKGNDA